MRDDAHPGDKVPHRTAVLALDLSEEQLQAAPVLRSADVLVIEDLTEDEDDAFAAALHS